MGRWERAEELYRQGAQLDASLQSELVQAQIGARGLLSRGRGLGHAATRPPCPD